MTHYLMTILLFIVVFGIVVISHEFGHFIIARMNGIHVVEFMIGMGPKLISWKKKDTLYSIRLLPIGGACLFEGEDGLNEKEGDAKDSKGAFPNANVWSRIATVAAGPIFNFILAFLVAVIMVPMIQVHDTVIRATVEESAAEEAGLQAGDKIIKLDGERIYLFSELQIFKQMNKGKSVKVTYERDGKRYETVMTPKYNEASGAYEYGIVNNNVLIGAVEEGSVADQAGLKADDVIVRVNGQKIYAFDELYQAAQKSQGGEVTVTYVRDGEERVAKMSPRYDEETGAYYFGLRSGATFLSVKGLKSIQYGWYEVRAGVRNTYKSLLMLVGGKLTRKDVAGPVGMAHMVGEIYEETKEDWRDVLVNMMNLIMLISVSLGIMNILPFPALDGGRLVFLIIEVFRGKPVPPEKEGIVHFVGLVFFMVLMVVVMFNDILNIIH